MFTMATDFSKLIQDLQSKEPEILHLALGTVGRTRFKDLRLDRNTVLSLYQLVLEHCQNEDSDLGFLARKAREQMHLQLPWLKEKHDQETAFKTEDLHHPDAEIRFQAITTLINAPPKDAQRILIWHFLRERNPKVLASMVLALIDSENPKVVSLLQAFLYAQDDRLRANAVEAIDALGEREQILSMLPVLLNDPNNRVRANALKAVARFAPRDILAHLEQMIASPEVSRRASALYVLKNMRGDGIARLLSIAATDPFIDNRLKVIELCSQLPDREADVVLNRLSQDEDIDVSEQALQALRIRGEKQEQDNSGFDIQSIRKVTPQKTSVDTRPADTPDPMQIQAEAEAMDTRMDAEILLIGQSMRKGIKSGLFRNLREDSLLGQVLAIDKLEQQVQARQAAQKSGFAARAMRQVGFYLQSDLDMMDMRGRLEDAYLELGYETVRIARESGTVFVGMMDRIKKVEALFLQRKQLDKSLFEVLQTQEQP